MPTSVRFIGLAAGRVDPPAGGYALVEPRTGGGVLVETPAGGGVEPTGAMPTSVRFIETAPLGGGVEPACGGGTETTLGGGVERAVAGGREPALGAGGAAPAGVAATLAEVEPGLGGHTLVDPAGGGVLLVDVLGRGGGVEVPGATPMSVFFIDAAVEDVAGGDGRGGTDELGRNAAPQALHSAVSGLAGDPHRGHEIILADYFSCSQNAMA